MSESEFPCPTGDCPPLKEPAKGFWAKKSATACDAYRCFTVEAIYISDISQADANQKAYDEALRLAQRKLTHRVSPIGSRQLSKLKEHWF